jgi:hypothetical protein
MKAASRLLLLVWLVGVMTVVAGGAVLDGYAQYVLGLHAPQPYPYDGVAQYIIIATVECAIVFAILRPSTYRASRGRAVLSLMAATVLAALHAVTLMHSTTYQLWHELWLFAFCLSLAIATTASAFSAVRTRSAAR